jgi:hypothetical protein
MEGVLQSGRNTSENERFFKGNRRVKMYRNEKDCLCNLLDCGIDDLEMIKDCKYNLRELVNRYITYEEAMPDINGLIEEIFTKGRDALEKAVWEESKRLRLNGINENESPLKEFGSLSAYADIRYEANCFVPYIRFVGNEKLWRRYFQKEIEKVENDMGFKIQHSDEFIGR